jgi:hypothetical protein
MFFSQTGSTLSFAVPNKTKSSDITFSIQVSDGEFQVSKEVGFVIQNKPSGGSMVYLLIFMEIRFFKRNNNWLKA